MEPKRRHVAAPVRIADEDGVCSQGRRQGEHIFAAGEIPGEKSPCKIGGVMLYYVRKDMKYKQKGRQKWRKKN